MENIKILIIGVLSSVAAYFHPITHVLFSLFYLFLLNLLFGLVAGITINKEVFSFRKAFNCMKETAVFFLILASIYTVGEKMGNPSGALQCVTAVTYAFIYFYTVNILKNLRRLFPASRGLAFVYYAVSFEFVRKVPFLSDFINQEKEEKTNG